MKLSVLVAATAVVVAIARLVVYLVRERTSDPDRIFSVVLVAVAASGVAAGLIAASYPFVLMRDPSFADSFYKDQITDPVFIALAGVALLICGVQGIVIEFRKALRRPQAQRESSPTAGSSSTKG